MGKWKSERLEHKVWIKNEEENISWKTYFQRKKYSQESFILSCALPFKFVSLDLLCLSFSVFTSFVLSFLFLSFFCLHFLTSYFFLFVFTSFFLLKKAKHMESNEMKRHSEGQKGNISTKGPPPLVSSKE